MRIMRRKNSNRIVIGKRDKIDFPKLSLYDVDAKIQLIDINPL